ncbi:sensor histidine kinase [Paenibacillus protaetiae]|nr:sensor histidine kinase [Paenibacillus protaetiae]
MKSAHYLMIGALIFIIGTMFQIQQVSLNNESKQNVSIITKWDYQWLNESGRPFSAAWADDADPNKWEKADPNSPMTKRANQATALLLRVQIPPLPYATPGIWLKRVYGTAVSVSIEHQNNPIYQIERSYGYDVNYALLPLTGIDNGSSLIILLRLSEERQSLEPEMVVGDYYHMLPQYERFGLIELFYGGSFLFIALAMVTCLFFLKREQRSMWMSLCFIFFCLGVIIVSYSPAFYHHYGAYGKPLLAGFDIALFLIAPALAVFFEQVLGPGIYGMTKKFRQLLMPATAILVLLWVLGKTVVPSISLSLLEVLPVTIMGSILFIILMIHSIGYASKGNQDAIILLVGHSVFTVVTMLEIIRYFQDETYHLIYWKWGLLLFLLSLIAVMGRQFSANHDQLVQYSQELEMFNREIQRSEKMELISQLAASIAHEVRNPLQVTRGFLQLLGEKAVEKDRQYLTLAIEELDRASGIITQFLTFAKPQMDDVATFNITEELYTIYDMLKPLSVMQSATLELVAEPELYTVGNADKFKQAVINMIKNSLEATTEGEGWIRIHAAAERKEIVIHVLDNGEGIDQEAMNKLGEPYFSSKSKGTGLGLMVTFRIIEAMNGTLRFNSTKGEGTAAAIRLPAAAAPKKEAHTPD